MIRLGFLGTGWIGRNRMEAMLATGKAEAVGICDPDPRCAAEAAKIAPHAILAPTLEDVLALKPDGVVIATPSALHARQSIEVLESGAAVFCQKPLGRNAAEVEAVLRAAGAADRLLGVDLSYRHTAVVQAMCEQIKQGSLGKIFAADLVFHNAYGPQSSWFWDPRQAGGGCLMDLGVHLVDLALWLLGFPAIEQASGRLFRQGRLPSPDEVEDYAVGSLGLVDGTDVRIACSWNLSAGTDAVIRATFHGTEGSVEMRNVSGSFYDFTAELHKGRERTVIASPPDEWGGRAGVDWLEKLARGAAYSETTDGLLATARAIDSIYSDPAEQRRPAKAAITPKVETKGSVVAIGESS